MASRSSIEAGRGHVVLGVDAGPLTKGLNDAKAQFQSWGKEIAALGAGIAAAGAAVSAPYLYGLKTLADEAAALTLANRQTGIGFENLQMLAFALKTDLEGLGVAVRKMDQFLQHLANGAPEAQHAMMMLGLSLDQVQRASQEERVMLFAEALNKVSDPANRAALAVAIFGKHATSMNFGNLESQMRRLRELGGVVSADDVRAGQEFNAVQREFSIVIKALWSSIGATAVPLMKEWLLLLTSLAQWAKKVVDENRTLFDIVFRVADKVVLLGMVVAGLGIAIYVLGSSFGWLIGIWSAFVTAWGIIKAVFVAANFEIYAIVGAIAVVGLALTGLILAVGYFTGAMEGWKSFDWAGMGNEIATAFSGISAALSTGNFSEAWGIALAYMKLAWEEFKNFLVDGWLSAKFLILNSVYEIATAIRRTVQEAVGAARIAWAEAQERMGLASSGFAESERATNRMALRAIEMQGVSAVHLETADRTEEDQLRDDLEMREFDAQFRRDIQDAARQAGRSMGPDGDLQGMDKFTHQGSFFADSIRGFEGAGGNDIPAIAVHTREQVMLLRRMAERLDNMEGLVVE